MTAASPEELEVLLEDALLLRDAKAVADLFEDNGVLVTGPGSVTGRDDAAGALAERGFIAAPWSVTVLGDIAVVVGARTVNISCRGTDKKWRLIVAVTMPAS